VVWGFEHDLFVFFMLKKFTIPKGEVIEVDEDEAKGSLTFSFQSEKPLKTFRYGAGKIYTISCCKQEGLCMLSQHYIGTLRVS